MKTDYTNSKLMMAAMILIPPMVCPSFLSVRAQQGGIAVKIRTIDPDPAEGMMTRFSSSSGAVLAGGSRDVVVPIDRIIRVETAGSDSLMTPVSALASRQLRGHMLFELAYGDWVIATPLEFTEDRCTLALAGGGELRVPPGAIVSLRPETAALPANADAVRSFMASDSRDEDRVLLSNGDVLRGFIDRLDATGLTMDSGTGGVVVPYRVVVVAKFATVSRGRPAEPFVRVHLRSGASLTCTSLDMSRGEVSANYVDGEIVAIGAMSIARLDVIGGRWQALSSLRPLTYEHAPMLGLHWEYRRDSNVLGDAIQVGGDSFETGLGVHSRSRLSFELKSQFVEFVTRFGMDDSAGSMADVDVSILVDGTTRFSRKGVRVGKLSEVVRVDVRHAKRIELVVDFGKNGDIQDRFNWVEPGLIR